MIVIGTSQDSASLIARLLDYSGAQKSEIFGTLAGNSTNFVAPRSIKCLNHTLREVKQLLSNFR